MQSLPETKTNKMTKEEAVMTARTRMVSPAHFVVITIDSDGKMNSVHSCSLGHLIAARDLVDKAIQTMVYGGVT